MDIRDFDKYFARCTKELEQAIGADIPRIVANRGVELFKHNFQQQGFFGRRWQDVKRRTNPPKSQLGKASTMRPILTGATGNLGRSIQARPGNASVTFSSDLPYSSAHNYGTNNAGRHHRTRIPQRQFMGDHPQIDQMVQKTIAEQLDKLFR